MPYQLLIVPLTVMAVLISSAAGGMYIFNETKVVNLTVNGKTYQLRADNTVQADLLLSELTKAGLEAELRR